MVARVAEAEVAVAVAGGTRPEDLAEVEGVDAERLAAFHQRAASASRAMACEAARSRQEHAALRQAVGEDTVQRWYDEHQAEVQEQRRGQLAQGEGLGARSAPPLVRLSVRVVSETQLRASVLAC